MVGTRTNPSEHPLPPSEEEPGTSEEGPVPVPVPMLREILNRLDRLETMVSSPDQEVYADAEPGYDLSQRPTRHELAQSRAGPPPTPTVTTVKQPDPVKPDSLQANVSLEQFDVWRASYEDYTACTSLDTLPRAHQLARFRGFLSTEMRLELVHGIGISDSDISVAPRDILDKIRNYLRDKINIAVDRVRFEERKQLAGESFDDFLISLRRIAGNADLCKHCIGSRLTTRVMVGIECSETRKKLLALKPFPDLTKVIDICRSEECARKNEDLLCDSARARVVQKAVTRPRSRSRRPQARSKGRADGRGNQCGRCGYEGRHVQGSDCPALTRKCNRCGKTGHYGQMRRSTCKGTGAVTKQNETGVRRVQFEVSSARCVNPKSPKIAVSVHHGIDDEWEGECHATPDTGSEGTVAGIDVMRHLGIDEMNLLQDGEIDLFAANGQRIDCIGKAMYGFKYKGRYTKDMVYFCRGLKGMLLPWYVCKNLGVLPACYPEQVGAEVRAIEKENKFLGSNLVTIPEIERVVGKIPDGPSPEEIERIQDRMIQEFHDVFDSSEVLRPMDCPPLKIQLKADAKPFCLSVPRQIPLAYRGKVKAQLDKLVAQGITMLQGDEPAEWCHAIVCVPKPNGDVRVCVDLTKLNEHVDRPVHPFKSPKDAVTGIPSDARCFSVFDATSGYFQMELDKDSQKYTVFITPWGRYRFLRSPMGLVSTGDEFCRQGDLAFHDITHFVKVVDDILEYDSNFGDHLVRVWSTLQRCREKRITLNSKKMQFAKPEVKFVGYVIGVGGIKADPGKVKAILDFPPPENITALRGFFGIVNQLSEFSSDVAEAAQGLRPLLSAKNAFVWSAEQESCFRRVKEALTTTPALAHFELERETALQTDASRKGLGFVLLQKQELKWRPIMYGSRYVTPTESRYAVIELEMLGVAWAILKCRVYLIGLPSFHVITDHKPLVPILNDYTMDRIDNPRLLRLKDKVAGYVFHAVWRKGKENAIPDALSRAPHREATEEDLQLERSTMLVSVMQVEATLQENVRHEDPNLMKVSQATASDKECQALIEVITAGVPSNWVNRWPDALPLSFIFKTSLPFFV